MITRLENIQVGKGQYLYKTGRCIFGTKSMELMNRLGMSGCVHRLVKGEQNEKDNERVIEEDHRIKAPKKIKETIPTLCGRHNFFQPLLWVQQVACHVTFMWTGQWLGVYVCPGLPQKV